MGENTWQYHTFGATGSETYMRTHFPACQLRKIQGYVNALYAATASDVPFWIDTVCVPREGQLRALAILSMKDVYVRADKVLVLDSTLQQITSAAPPEDILLAIELAPWSSRLWTWHESVLACRLYFQLQDQAIEGDNLLTLYNTEFANVPTTVSIQNLLDDYDGPNSRLCRRLLRVMSLSRGVGEFLNKEDVDISGKPQLHHITGEDLETYIKMVNTGTLAEVPPSESRNDDSDNKVQSNPSSTAQVTSSTLSAEAVPNSDAETWREKAYWLSFRNRVVGWYFPTQKPPLGPSPAIPPDLIAEGTLSASEKELEKMIGKIFGHPGNWRYWLRGFDLVFEQAFAFYQTLRFTSTGQDLLRMKTPCKLRDSSISAGPSQIHLADAIHMVSHRVTSWIEDEAICFAIILDMDVSKVLRADRASRMETLVRMWKVVPRGLLFIPGPRMELEGLRWMPRSLLGCGWGDITRIEEAIAQPTQRGLLIDGMGLVFDLSHIKRSPGDVTRLFDGTTRYSIVALKCDKSKIEDKVGAVIFQVTPAPGSASLAVLVTVESNEDDVIHARYCRHVTVLGAPTAGQTPQQGQFPEAHFTPTTLQQKWCVG